MIKGFFHLRIKIIKIVTVACVLLLGIANFTNTTDMIINYLVLLVTIISLLYYFVTHKLGVSVFSLGIICILFLISAQLNSVSLRQQIADEPMNNTYRTDMDDFLKTYYLMNQGNNYYTSFKTAIEQNPFKGQVSTNLWSWRLPTIFYIWLLVPGNTGLSIYYLFLVNCIGILIGSFFLVEVTLKLLGKPATLAIIAPYFLYPYLHFAVRDMTFLHTEWWVILPMILGIFFSLKQKYLISTIFFALSVCIRELLIFPILIALLIAGVKKQKQFWYLIPILMTLGIYIIFHGYQISNLINLTSNFLTPRLAGGKNIVLATLAFGSWEYLFYYLRIFIWIFIIVTFGWLFMIKKNIFFKYSGLVILSAFCLYPLIFLIIGTSVYNDYWGIIYMPIMLISLPIAVSNLW